MFNKIKNKQAHWNTSKPYPPRSCHEHSSYGLSHLYTLKWCLS